VDGTFSVVSKPYYQLYMISFISDNHVFPSIFGMLKNKKKETYNNFFSIIKQLININEPRFIKTDFEHASLISLRESFPNSQISGCLFHLGQSIMRKVKQMGYMVYNTDVVFKKYVKYLIHFHM
jgi:hypothetical protein